MYAQILKPHMRVNLIGGVNEGLPIEHESVICVDIGKRTDVKLHMKYNEETGEFYESPFTQEELPEETSIEERFVKLEEENTKLKNELEVTQAVVDELLFGGGM